MKNIIISLSVIFLFPKIALCKAIGGGSTITNVTVYKDRAHVTRGQSLFLPKGAHSILFKGITPKADKDSFKVKIADSKSVDLMGFRIMDNHLEKSDNKKIERLKKEHEQLKERRQRLIERVQALTRGSEHLRSMAKHYKDSFTIKLHANSWSPNQFKSLVAFLGAKSQKLQSKWKKLYLESLDINKNTKRVVAKTRELASVTDGLKLDLLVDVIVRAPGKHKVSAKYLVDSVGWSPVYDLRISKKTADLEQYAMVWQQSGEDWLGVNLQLSNVRSEIQVELPKINRYNLSFRKVEKVSTTIKSDEKTNIAMFVEKKAFDSVLDSPLDRALEVSFKISGKQTIAHGLKNSKVFIQKANMPYSQRWESIPSKFKYVFKRLEFSNPFDFQLSAGPMQVYNKGEYVNERWQMTVEKNAKFAINSGIDHNMVVNYSAASKTREPGLIDRKKHFIKSYKTSIDNFNEVTKTVRVRKQVPLSEIEGVQVSLVEGKETTEGFIMDKDYKTWIYWDLEIPSRKMKIVKADIDVAVPKGVQFNW